MLAEIRTYTLHPGRRDEFVGFFESEVLPAMHAHGMRVLGPFIDPDDPDVFVYVRTWRDRVERDRHCERFYASETWLGGMRDRAMAMERDYSVRLVASTPGAVVHVPTEAD